MTSRSRAYAGLLALLGLAYLVYLPGLSAGFLFDDFVNLNAIGATGPVDNWATFFRYVTSGTADPTGRPLALLSFLMDARDWPAEPRRFLHTNLLLHLVNGALLFGLLRVLGTILDGASQRTDAAGLIAAGLWLLHPLLVSTTLYSVQREAMLPATFMLMGLLCYLHGRSVLHEENPNRGLLWMTIGIVGGTLLATLCKANGILLPLLAWVLEKSVLQHGKPGNVTNHRAAKASWILLALPSLALLIYLATFLGNIHATIPDRGWSVGQRLLTESRVLATYLHLLMVPRSVSTGLYNDAYVVSSNLFLPFSTLPSVLLVVFLPIAAWISRKRYPSLAAAILFYFSGHLLESSAIPLEIYFEHRNYIPSMLLFWPVSRAICAWRVDVRWRSALAVCLLGLFALTTYQRTALWGKPQLQATLWAEQNPDSSRAQATAAMIDTSSGLAARAVQRLGPIWRQRPTDMQIAFNYVSSSCALGRLSEDDSLALEIALRRTNIGLGLAHRWLESAIETAAENACSGLTLDAAERWVAAAASNPNLGDPDSVGQEIEPLRAQLAMHRKQGSDALDHFNLALAAFTTPDVAARQASSLARKGFYREALAHLDNYEALKDQVRRPGRGMPQLHAKVLEWQGYWPREMGILRAKLIAEISAASPGQPPQ